MNSFYKLRSKNMAVTIFDMKHRFVSERATVSMFFFLSGLIFSTFTSRIPGLQERFSIDNAQLGILLACLPIGLIISLPFAGWVTHQLSIKLVLLCSSISYLLILLILGFSTKVWHLYFVLFLFGATRTFFNVTINTISVVLQSKYKTKIINSFHGIWSLAALLGALLSLLFVGNDISIQLHVVIVSTGCFIFILIYSKHIPVTISSQNRFKLTGVKQKKLFVLGFIAFCCMFCEGIMGDWSGIYFSQVGGVSKKYYVVGYTFYLIAMLVGRFVGDRMTSKFGEFSIIKFSSILLSAGFLISIFFTQPFLITIGFVLVGFGVSCIIPIAFLLSSKNTSVPVGMAISTVSMMGYVGFLIGSPLIGFISNSFNLRWAFLTCLLFSISIFFCSQKYARERS